MRQNDQEQTREALDELKTIDCLMDNADHRTAAQLLEALLARHGEVKRIITRLKSAAPSDGPNNDPMEVSVVGHLKAPLGKPKKAEFVYASEPSDEPVNAGLVDRYKRERDEAMGLMGITRKAQTDLYNAVGESSVDILEAIVADVAHELEPIVAFLAHIEQAAKETDHA